MVSFEEIEKLSKLARIKLEKNEEEELQKDLEAILGYVAKLNPHTNFGIAHSAHDEVNVKVSVGVKVVSVKDVARMSGGVDVANVFREDKNPHPSAKYTKELLEAVPSKEEGFVKVKHVFD